MKLVNKQVSQHTYSDFLSVKVSGSAELNYMYLVKMVNFTVKSNCKYMVYLSDLHPLQIELDHGN